MTVTITKSSLTGTLQVPGSKSHTIRAVLLATLSEGESLIHNPLVSGDGLSAISAAKAFGATVTQGEGGVVIQGKGKCLQSPESHIDTRNSGTTTSFVTSMASLAEGYTFITGDEQVRARPIRVLVEALRQLGVELEITRPNHNAPPLFVKGGLEGGSVTLDGFNSQFVSSLLLVSPLGKNKTEIHVRKPLEKPYVQMTLDWIRRFGARIESDEPLYTHFVIEGGQRYTGGECTIPSDWSAVAFPLVAALVSPSSLTITGLNFEDAQGDKRIVELLMAMGADLTADREAGSLVIKGGKKLKGGQIIDLGDIHDALPALSVAALFAQGRTVFTNLAHVRVKESDRVLVMAEELAKLGAEVEITSDQMIVHGGRPLHGGVVESHGDHRVAMALTAAALMADGPVEVKGAECAEVSYPQFFASLAKVGVALSLVSEGVGE